ncbi:ROK family transcriptional regulator [Microlunatus sp. Gsoil 973]|uniref:ROK family transcriptional regulator n=1 Tax=Microlunatus sp. Gsoil 973 TaxID=2672569 RepID=UPI0012B45C26|nr:ROK family transcriptional regulator [Microlunatus sp. Gsoil 973]QGN33770.1 ROK family protein [Microlunatus sp. Gsoil 973]
MTPAKPSLELLRSLTDEHVLRALITERRLTRAEIAARTGISKPTIGESIRRLAASGLVHDTGERTTGRGRVGTYYALSPGLATALVVGIAPEGIVAEAVDVYGDVVARQVEEVGRPAVAAQVAQHLRTAAMSVLSDRAGIAVVSAADPVDRATGRLIHLPYAPFLVGELSPADVLAPLVDGPVLVDNDVNWAATTERASADAAPDDFAYLYLGEGLGCAVVTDGEVRRGHRGLAGEVADVLTCGPRGRATRFIDVFATVGLHQPGSTAIDVPALLAALDQRTPGVIDVLAEAIAGVVAALIALDDPQFVVLGGSWGQHPVISAAVTGALAQQPRAVPVRPPLVTGEPALAGARRRAVEDLRTRVTRASTSG